MFRKKLLVLLIVLLFLAGCSGGKGPTQQAIDFRTDLMQAQKCEFVAQICADYGDKVYQFGMKVQCEPQQTVLTVVEPAELAGISAKVSKESAVLEFDGVSLEFGKMANGYISPVMVPWLLRQCWENEYIAYAGADEDAQRITYLYGSGDAELVVDTWINKDGVPFYAEITHRDLRYITVEIKDFQM